MLRLERIEKGLAKPPSEYLDTEAAAVFTSISAVQLAEWRSRGGGPRYIKMGRKVLYAVRDLRNFVESFGKEALQ
ncbi:helix-turn-helix transcriptional regulator [Methylopila musalis]|uniref:Helix-turn-helix transcriptional regulator n=1 Tax=Methylopila musalis TaxID=1134781 RepID=A0ABW3Z4J6_9HYPH